MPNQSSANWQESFVATNLLALGYNAWCGFLTGERGAVVCSLRSPELSITGESCRAYYVPRSRLFVFRDLRKNKNPVCLKTLRFSAASSNKPWGFYFPASPLPAGSAHFSASELQSDLSRVG